MIHDKTYLRYQVLPLNKQLKGGSKNYDIFDKTPNFGSEKSFQLKSKIRNFDDLNQDYNKNYDVYSKVSRNKITNINPIYPQYNLLLPKINVTFKRPNSSIILTEEQKEIKKLVQELITVDREIERLKGDEHESIVERLQKESQKQSGGAKKPIKKIMYLTKLENFLYKKLEKDWKIYLNKTKNPISKEKFTKKWWKKIKMIHLASGTQLGAIAGAIGVKTLAFFSLLGAFTGVGLAAVAAAPVIGLGGVGLVISYLRYKYQKEKVNSVEKVKKLLKEEIEKRKKEIEKLKQSKLEEIPEVNKIIEKKKKRLEKLEQIELVKN